MFISKEMNKQRNAKHLLLRKTDILKTCRKSKFLGENWIGLEVQGIIGTKKGTRHNRGNAELALLSSAVFRLQNSVSDFF